MPIGQKQCVSQLRLLLYGRPLHPELFDIYHDHRLAKNGYEAQIWVTGVSHLIAFHRGDATVTELIAETATMLPDRGRLAVLRLRGERDHEIEQAGGIRHMISFQVETMSSRLYAQTHSDLTDQGAKGGLLVPFPQWTYNGLTPFTYIDYEAKADQLHVFAYHAFPDELTLIKTQSIFELT